MRDLFENYVRSLIEQEQARDAPEYHQDLGTFVDWLLLRRGFNVLERTFKYVGPVRIKVSGERQWGADILATKPDGDGALRGYRFVLKQGDIGQGQWKMEDGYLPEDLWLAAGRPRDDLRNHGISGPLNRWTVVAVHNGEFRTNQIGPQRESLIQRIEERYVAQVEWWDARRLVELATASLPGAADAVSDSLDPGLFPPGMRPFARLALDSLVKGTAGNAFDLGAVDRLIDAVLPNATPTPFRRWKRVVSELGLFGGMVDTESRVRPEVRGSTVPALETYERILSRATHHASSWGDEISSRERTQATDLLKLLLRQYLYIARRLLTHLTPLFEIERGMAAIAGGEILDYPLRAIRLVGYLAVAGHACRDLGDEPGALAIGAALRSLCGSNPGGALSPVLDDQVVELAILWDLWNCLGDYHIIIETAQEVARRMLLKRSLGLRLPALWMDGGLPMEDRALRLLVESQYRRGDIAGFEDGGSLILPLAIYLGWRAADPQEADGMMRAVSPGAHTSEAADKSIRVPRTIYMQSWRPPDDAIRNWYCDKLAHKGTSYSYRVGVTFAQFAQEFETFNRPIPGESLAEVWNLRSLDRIAWKRLRNPPPLSLFVTRRDQVDS